MNGPISAVDPLPDGQEPRGKNAAFRRQITVTAININTRGPLFRQRAAHMFQNFHIISPAPHIRNGKAVRDQSTALGHREEIYVHVLPGAGLRNSCRNPVGKPDPDGHTRVQVALNIPVDLVLITLQKVFALIIKIGPTAKALHGQCV